MWRRRLVAARCCRSSRIRTGVLRSGGADAGWTGVYVGWNGACVAAGAASKREADVDNSAVSSRGKDSTRISPRGAQTARRPAATIAPDRPATRPCLSYGSTTTHRLLSDNQLRTRTTFDYKPAANPTSRTLP